MGDRDRGARRKVRSGQCAVRSAQSARVLLKGRPTERQLADRLAEPVPAGLELYLAAEDIADQERLERLASRLRELRPDPSFVYVVEGPLRSLDGAFFDLSVANQANRECLRRVAWLAGAIGAEAILIHLIAPSKLATPLTPELHREKLAECIPLVSHYVEVARQHGVVPLLENIPPVARQRERSYMVTPVGMSAGDLAYFAERFPGLGVTVDLSHAGLFLNGLRMAPQALAAELWPLLRYLATLGDSPAIEDYLRAVEPYLFEVHVSNARGLLEEGLPYGDGDLDLDALASRLSRSVRYLVTETIEPDPDRAVHMREAQRRLETAVGLPSGEGEMEARD